ncbi:MOS1T transposase, partial [Pseudoatta argentina]
MSIFVPNKVYLRGILLHYFIQKKSAAEAHRIPVQTYGDNALSDTTCRDWFRRFKNNDFELEDKERSGAPKKFQDKELEQLLDEKNSNILSDEDFFLHMLLSLSTESDFQQQSEEQHNLAFLQKNIVTLERVRAFPKAGPSKKTIDKRKINSAIITDTPEKQRVLEKK